MKCKPYAFFQSLSSFNCGEIRDISSSAKVNDIKFSICCRSRGYTILINLTVLELTVLLWRTLCVMALVWVVIECFSSSLISRVCVCVCVYIFTAAFFHVIFYFIPLLVVFFESHLFVFVFLDILSWMSRLWYILQNLTYLEQVLSYLWSLIKI